MAQTFLFLALATSSSEAVFHCTLAGRVMVSQSSSGQTSSNTARSHWRTPRPAPVCTFVVQYLTRDLTVDPKLPEKGQRKPSGDLREIREVRTAAGAMFN